MSCNEGLLQEYVEGLLDPAGTALMDGHLATCPACRRGVAAYKALLWDLEHLPAAPVPPGLASVSDRLMAAWDQAQAADAATGPARSGWRLAWAEASLAWTRASPVVNAAVGAVGRAGRTLPGVVGVAALKWLLRRGGGRR